MKILVTGFKPFAGEKVNPSERLLPLLEGPNVAVKLLPVEYEGAFTALKGALLQDKFAGVILIGQASGRKLVSLEKVAVNWQEADLADEGGLLQTGGPVNEKGPDAILNQLPISQWVRTLKGQGLPVEMSLTAGAFVCNSTYFRVLDEMRSNSQFPLWGIFVHVPYLPEQLVGKPENTAALPLEKMAEVLRGLLGLIQQEKNLRSVRAE